MALPDRETFPLENLNKIELCGLCHSGFGGEHTPTRIRRLASARPLTSATTSTAPPVSIATSRTTRPRNGCPGCHIEVFVKPSRKPLFKAGSRNPAEPAMTLDKIPTSVEADKFVHTLFRRPRGLFENKEIFDSDIQEQIDSTLDCHTDCYVHGMGMTIKSEHITAVDTVAR